MSHVDEGTLHAYLDGELTPAEAQGVDAHIAQCPGCRERLDVERALITRTQELLALAAPPDRDVPPFRAGARKPPRRLWWQVRLPLAWAATVVLAIGIGTLLERGVAPLPIAQAPREVDTMRPATPPASGAVDLARDQRAARRRDLPSSPPPPSPAAVAKPSVAGERVMRQRDEPVAAQAEAREGALNAKIAMKNALDDERFQWARGSPISADSARRLLGADPLVVGGLPIRAIYRGQASGYSALVLVEQKVDSTTVIEVVTGRPSPTALGSAVVTDAGAAAPRRDTVSRFERGLAGRAATADSLAPSAAPAPRQSSAILFQEVRGPLSADSLASLRRRLRPLRP
jgi:hypothetical protein